MGCRVALRCPRFESGSLRECLSTAPARTLGFVGLGATNQPFHLQLSGFRQYTCGRAREGTDQRDDTDFEDGSEQPPPSQRRKQGHVHPRVVSMTRPAVTAVIAVRNGSPTINDCLNAIATQSYPAASIMIVDDASTDETVRLVRERCDPLVEIIELAANVGPAEARNLALTRVTTDLVWIVDADCVPAPDCLAKLCAVLSADPAIGIVGGPNPQNPRTSTYAAAAFDFSNRYLVDRAAPPTDVPYVVGANMLFRRAVVEQVGAYDPNLRIAEDFDLCVRARQAGWRVVFEPRAVSEHRHPRSTIASYLRYQYKIGRYGCRFRVKHRAAVPFGRWYPTTPAKAVLLAPAYVAMALGRIVAKNVAVGATRPLLWYLPLIAVGQCWVIAGVIRGLGDLEGQ
jgi:GT2 family glycosyltransferase